MIISVFLTASCMERNSLRNCSRACASRNRADFVIALGATARLALGPRRLFSAPGSPCTGVAGEVVLDGASAGVLSLGVPATEVALLPSSSPSPSSTPNDNLPLATAFRFFLFGRSCGVEPLCFDHQLLHLNPVHLIVPASSSNLPITHGSQSCGTYFGPGTGETAELFLLERIGATFAEIV